MTNLTTWFCLDKKITLILLQFESILGVTRHILCTHFFLNFFSPSVLSSMIHFLCFVLFESRRNGEKKCEEKIDFFIKYITCYIITKETIILMAEIGIKKRIEMWLICGAFFVFLSLPSLPLFPFLNSMCLKIHWQTDRPNTACAEKI